MRPCCRSLTHHRLSVVSSKNWCLVTARNSEHCVVTHGCWFRDTFGRKIQRGSRMYKDNDGQSELIEVSAEPSVSLPSGGWHKPSISVLEAPGVGLLHWVYVYRIDLGFTLTLFDVSLLLLYSEQHTRAASLIERAEGLSLQGDLTDGELTNRILWYYLAKQFPLPLAGVQLIFHSRCGCWWLQSEFNIHLPTISRACHFGAAALFHALILAAISSNWHTRGDPSQSRGTEWLPIKCTWACLSE